MFAPLLASLVGGMGLLAAVLRREGRPAVTLPQPHRHGPSPRRTGAGSRASTCSTRSTSWDDVTAGVGAGPARPAERPGVLHRGRSGPSPSRCWTCCSPRTREPRVPVLALIDTRLAIGETDGWHYDDLPEDGQAWRDTLRLPGPGRRASVTDRGFARLTAPEQAALIQAVQDLRTARQAWHELSGRPGVEPVDPVRVHRVLLPPLGVERDRLPRPGLPPRLPEPRASTPATGGRSPRPPTTSTRCRSPTASNAPAADHARPAPPATERRERATTGDDPGPQRVGVAAPQRRLPHQPPAARRHAPLRRRRRGRPGRRRRRRRRQRADPAAGPRRLAGRLPGRRAVLGPGHRLGQRRTRLAHACTGPSRARSAATTRSRSGRTTPAAASAARWSTTPGTPRGSTRPTSTPAAATASAPTGRSATPT